MSSQLRSGLLTIHVSLDMIAGNHLRAWLQGERGSTVPNTSDNVWRTPKKKKTPQYYSSQNIKEATCPSELRSHSGEGSKVKLVDKIQVLRIRVLCSMM